MKALKFSPHLAMAPAFKPWGHRSNCWRPSCQTAAMSTGEVGNSNDFSETHEVENETSHFFFDGIEKTQLFFGNGNFEDVMVRIFLWKSPMMDGLVSLLRHEHQSREIFSVGWKGRCSFCSENTTLSFTHVFCQQDRFQEFSDWGIIISLNVEDCMLGIFLPVAGGGECFRSNLKCYFVWSMHLLFWCLNMSLPKIAVATKHEWFEYCELCVTYSYDGCGCFPNHCSFTSILVLDQCLQDNISFFAISDILGYSSETGWYGDTWIFNILLSTQIRSCCGKSWSSCLAHLKTCTLPPTKRFEKKLLFLRLAF